MLGQFLGLQFSVTALVIMYFRDFIFINIGVTQSEALLHPCT